MRGLPPLGDTIFELRLGIAIDTSSCEIVQHFYVSDGLTWDSVAFAEFNSGWATFAETHLLNCMPSDASFDVFRLRRYGSLPFQHVNLLPTNAGALGPAQSLNTALCITWRTSAVGYSARARNRFPLSNDAVGANNRALDPTFVSLFQLQADQYIVQANSVPVSGHVSPELVAVSRVSGGAPRPSVSFSPVLTGNASLHCATLAARTGTRR